ncbi:MAG: glycosyltransferase [Meiothermus sp.]|nr:glycosyltransferase [Meiothermus sp.]
MRILFLSPDYPSQVHPSACIFVQTQALALQSLGVSVEVHAPTPAVLPGLDRIKPAWRDYTKIPSRYEREGIKVYRPRYLALPRENLWAWPHVIKSLTVPENVGSFDVIHAHFAHPEGSLGLILKNRLRKPLVVTLHGDDANTYPYQSARYLRYFQKVLAEADLVLAVSERMRERVQALVRRSVVTHRVGLRLPPRAERPDRLALRARLGLPLDRFVLLFVGMLWKYKGVIELAEALNQLDDPGVMALLIGDGPLRDTLVSTSRTALVCLGPLPNPVVRDYMAAADAFILPSYREGLPTVVVEAGAAGLPVIASQYGGTPELVTPQTGYPIEEVSPDAIIRALYELRNNPEEAQARAERLRTFVYEHLDATKNAQMLLEYYRQLVTQMPIRAR